MATAKMPAPLHILSFADSLRGGGVERAMLRLAAGWLDAGARVTLAIGNRAGPLAAELPPHAQLAGGSLAAAVRRASPDVVFCPGNHYTLAAARLRWRLGGDCPPIVAKMSNALDRVDLAWPLRVGNRGWLRMHPLFCDRLVAMTPALAAETIAATGIAPGRVSVIPNPPARALAGAASLVLPPLPAGARLVIGVGRLVPQKRWDRLVAAIPLLADSAAQVVIVGAGPERARLLAQAAALGVTDRLHLPGHAADPMPVLARAAVAVLPSAFEGVPGVLREALSVGTPVVTTESSSAIADIVTGPDLGSIVPHDDAPALAAAIDRWLAPDARRPAPVPPPGEDSAARYLALFAELAR